MRPTRCDYACPTCERPWQGLGRCTACREEEDEERAVWRNEWDDDEATRRLMTGEIDD